MRVWRDWAEEHWEAVAMAFSIASALMVAVILAMTFNVITTRLDGLHRDAANAVPPVSDARSRVSDSSEAGAI